MNALAIIIYDSVCNKMIFHDSVAHEHTKKHAIEPDHAKKMWKHLFNVLTCTFIAQKLTI